MSLKDKVWFFKGYTIPKYYNRFLRWFVWLLPRDVIKWATVRLFAHGTSGKYAATHPDTLTLFTALDRWQEQ